MNALFALNRHRVLNSQPKKLDSTEFTTHVSGGSAYEVTTFATLDKIPLNFSDNPATKLDITAISDDSIKRRMD